MPRNLFIASPRPVRADDQLLVFAASDDAGEVHICLTPGLWEMLQAEAPLPCDADDRRDFALDAIARRACECEPTAGSSGVRMIFIG